jgi:hypothetical protein
MLCQSSSGRVHEALGSIPTNTKKKEEREGGRRNEEKMEKSHPSVTFRKQKFKNSNPRAMINLRVSSGGPSIIP